jgi:hypothetical protein
MQTANRNVWVIGSLIAFGAMAQIIFLQAYRINTLYSELEIVSRAKDVESDQSAELMYQLTQLRNQQEIDGMKQYVAGVVQAVNNPKHINEVWHAGYDRGAAVQRDTDSYSQQKVHTSAD